MADDGLSQEEMVKLLFKNYMNFGSSSHSKDFFEETVFENNTNIFSNEIMADRPTKTPVYTNASDAIVKSYLEKNDSNLYIDSSWVYLKTIAGESSSLFKYDTNDDSILRLEQVKLDYLGGNSNAFGCYDSSSNNILRNLIPFNYSLTNPLDYAATLWFKDVGDYMTVPWTKSLSQQRLLMTNTADDNINWGAPLLDMKNGVVTFYDVSSSSGGQEVFEPTDACGNLLPAPEFYISCTKYVGAMGISGGTGGTVTVSGGSFTNDHLDFNDTPIITLAALDTTLSGEIVSVVGGGTANNDHLDFEDATIDLVALDTTTISTTHVGGDMTISKKLGIGNSTTTPEFSLDVHDSTDLSGINGYYLDGSNATIKTASNMTSSITIRAQNDILSGGKIIAESDRRIKKDIVDLSEIESLDLVRNLRPKKYHYIDSTQKNRELVYGYIAQEVKEVLPSAVQHIRGAIPSIFELAQASRSKNNNKGTMLTFHHYNTQKLDPSCEVLKLVDAGQNDHLVHITKIVDTRRLEIEERVDDGPIFVYGEEVNDFHVLSKDYINVVAVSALQQMDAHVTQLQEENRALRGELHEIKSILQNNGMI